MDHRNLCGYEGPRPVRETEWDDLVRLELLCFYPAADDLDDVVRTWPGGLAPELRRQTWVMLADGVPVTAIGHLKRDLLVAGQPLRMAFVGGVCTHPDHRERGLAGAVLQATFEHLRDIGVDLVYISGGRGLYRRAGAHPIGVGRVFRVDPGSAPPTEFRLRVATADDVPRLMRLAAEQPTRFRRRHDDWALIAHSGYCTGHPIEFLLAGRDDTDSAMLFVTQPEERDGVTRRTVLEFAGDPGVVAEVVSRLRADMPDTDRLDVRVPWRDPLAARLEAAGCESAVRSSGGTIKCLGFPRLIDRLRGYFAEHGDPSVAAALTASAAPPDRYVIASADGALSIDSEEAMLHTLFGSPDGVDPAGVRASGSLRELVVETLPVPLPAWDLTTI